MSPIGVRRFLTVAALCLWLGTTATTTNAPTTAAGTTKAGTTAKAAGTTKASMHSTAAGGTTKAATTTKAAGTTTKAGMTTTPTETVKLGFNITHVDYANLTDVQKKQIRGNVTATIAQKLKVSPSDMKVELSSGSVVVTVTITVAKGDLENVTSRAVEGQEAMGQSLALNVGKINGLPMSGPVSVVGFTVSVVTTTTTTTATAQNLTTTAASTTKTGDILDGAQHFANMRGALVLGVLLAVATLP